MEANKGCGIGGFIVLAALVAGLFLFKNLWKVILIAIGVVVAAIIVALVVTSSRDKKKRLESDIADGNLSEKVAAYRKMLSELMQFYYNIHDREVKDKLKQVEKAANRMIDTVRGDARDADSAGRFMRTALDGAKRVMQTYRRLESAPESADIQDAKRKAADALDKVIGAFEVQNKKLYENDLLSMDVETEVLGDTLDGDFPKTGGKEES